MNNRQLFNKRAPLSEPSRPARLLGIIRYFFLLAVLNFIFTVTLLCNHTVFSQFNKGDYFFCTICNFFGVTGDLSTKLAFVFFKLRHIKINTQLGPCEISGQTFYHSKNIALPLGATKIKKI